MPNGFHGTDEEWERIEAPLRPLDLRLEYFARQNGLRFAGSERNWPSRSLHWGDKVQPMLQLYLHDPDDLTWDFWVCASQDRHRKRYWRNAFLLQAVPIAEIHQQLDQLLLEGKRMADGWTSHDLDFATDLQL